MKEGAKGLAAALPRQRTAAASQKKKDAVEEAKGQFLILPRSLAGVYSDPAAARGRSLEYWPATEPGSPTYRRPEGLPMGVSGVEIFKDVSPIDVLADWVSHEGVKTDPGLKWLYSKFKTSVPDETMKQRYNYHVKNFGEQRPFDAWAEATGYPELFRGYTFGQFGEGAERFYSPEQIKILDQVKEYVGVRQRPRGFGAVRAKK